MTVLEATVRAPNSLLLILGPGVNAGPKLTPLQRSKTDPPPGATVTLGS